MNVFPLFRSGAVLPCGRKFPIWGEAEPREELTVEIAGQSFSCRADESGRWQLELPAFPPSEGQRLLIKGREEMIESCDLAFGEVFLLSGQSNMQLPVSRCLDAMPPFFEGLADTRIRELRVGVAPCFDQANQKWPEDSAWKSLCPELMRDFGALGLAFAKALLEDSDVPVGLVNCAVGGTPIESWLPLEELADDPRRAEEFAKYSSAELRKREDRAFLEQADAWQARAMAAVPPTEGYEAFGPDVFPDMLFDTPYKDFHGVLWLRTRFTLNAYQASSVFARLDLGCLYHNDVTYLNGREVGRSDYQYLPRRYLLPEGLLKEGENEILIRLNVPRHTGGAVAGKFYGLILDEETIPLGGDVWEIARGPELPVLAEPHFWDRLAGTNYYAYLQPIKGFPFTAALWYQGESNDQNPEDYAPRFARLIRRFRQDFGAKLPFVYVQLTRYGDPFREVPADSWAVIREAQRQALALPKTAMVVSLDVGEANDLHPQDKWSLGYRACLAYKALRKPHAAHGLSPELSSWFHTPEKLRLYFRLVGAGLWSDGNLAEAFVYQDENGQRQPAKVLELNENYLDLAFPAGADEAALKKYRLLFLYANDPPYAYLRSSDGLPVSPFILDLAEDGTS